MRKITKRVGFEPNSMSAWKRRNPQGIYADLTEVERQDIRTECAREQFHLCAYCCKPISGSNLDTMNEHVESRRAASHRSLDFTNIVGSCTTNGQCDDSHGSQHLPLTPFMNECETDLVFKISGRVSGTTADAKKTIEVLNLGDTEANNKSLIETRKQLSLALLLEHAITPEEEDDWADEPELLADVINDILTPDNGQLKPFAPVVANVLRQWIA